MLIVACGDGGLQIVDSFPAGFAPAAAEVTTYNPRARLIGPRIPASKLGILKID
jgi:hypothetical protein